MPSTSAAPNLQSMIDEGNSGHSNDPTLENCLPLQGSTTGKCHEELDGSLRVGGMFEAAYDSSRGW